MKKTFSKVLSIALVILLTGLMCITASATVLSGSGTKDDPYRITTPAELSAFSTAVADGNSFSGKFIVVENNINADNSFKPIGTEATPFKGTFNGNGKTLKATVTANNYAGLFAFTDGAVISGITVSGSFTSKASYAGAIVAFAKDTVIEKCNNEASVSAKNSYAGGIAGYIASGKIISCTSKLGVSATSGYAGGIAGFSGAEITDCTNSAYTYGGTNIGGIAGHTIADIVLCTNSATIKTTKSNLGGIAGLTGAAIRYCKNTGSISDASSTEKAGKVGGIAGAADNAEITECINDSKISAKTSWVGGIVGYASRTDITNCLSVKDVSNTATYAGGIFGFALTGTISGCVSMAKVTAKDNTSGAIGAVSQATVSDCYYNSTSANALYSGDAADTTALAAADFTDTAKLSKLDFTNTWVINTRHASYPLLVNIPFHTIRNATSTEPTCETDGIYSGTCNVCAEIIQKITPAYGHTNMIVSAQEATCTAAGYKDVICAECSKTETIILPATGHTDANTDNICDVCNINTAEKQPDTEKTFFQKVADFFNSIIEWIRNLFAGIFG